MNKIFEYTFIFGFILFITGSIILIVGQVKNPKNEKEILVGEIIGSIGLIIFLIIFLKLVSSSSS